MSDISHNAEKTVALEKVRRFWNTEACGTHFIKNPKDKREFYDKLREFRYRTEWHIPFLVPFSQAKGKSVLEIGCGNGVDGVEFARYGAIYTGVDLTQAAIDATREHFEILGLNGSFQIENAEHLSFRSNTFDIVFSWGVLHHTLVPSNAVNEIYRVLKPNGKAIVMLYHKHSFNYYVRIMGYMRLRVIMNILSHLIKHSEKQEISEEQIMGLRGNESKMIWDIHHSNFLKEGWGYLRARDFVHHCTDGPECPRAYVFGRTDAKKIFSVFKNIEMEVSHFPLRKYRFGRWVPFFIERFLASVMGWNLVVFATK